MVSEDRKFLGVFGVLVGTWESGSAGRSVLDGVPGGIRTCIFGLVGVSPQLVVRWDCMVV